MMLTLLLQVNYFYSIIKKVYSTITNFTQNINLIKPNIIYIVKKKEIISYVYDLKKMLYKPHNVK